MTAPKTIGSLNGPWAMLLKIALATHPVLLGWAIWVTTSIFALQQSVEVRSSLHSKERSSLELRLLDKIHQLPPEEWKKRVERLENKLDVIHTDIGEIKALVRREK